MVVASGAPSGPDLVAFEDDIESGGGAWALSAGPTDTGTAPWELTTSGTGGNGTSWFCSDEAVVKDQSLALADAVAILVGSELRLTHQFQTENGFDGGVLEYSTDSGATWQDILDGDGSRVPANPDRFIQNGYTGTISTQFSSPIGGRMAFEGNSGGFLTTVVDLTDFVDESLLVRFRMACDISVSSVGWWVDNVLITSGQPCCSPLEADIDPGSVAQGLTPLSFAAVQPCPEPDTTWDWLLDGVPVGMPSQDLTLPSVLTQTALLQLRVEDTLAATATILVADNPAWLDFDGDGCNGIADVWMAAVDWRTSSAEDADGTGFIDIRDLLYINALDICP